MQSKVIEFLQQSNYIENEPSQEALDDAVKAWEYIISKPRLNKGRILHTHKLLMATRMDIPKELKGHWRKPFGIYTGNVSVGGERKLPWSFVPMKMEDWIESVNNSLTSKYITEEVAKGALIAFHVLFENIHPFIDGNGRMGRILMNWHAQKLGLPIVIIREEMKEAYFSWFK